MITNSVTLLNNLRHPNGLFSASKKDVATGYNRTWIRDNIYTALGLEAVKDFNSVKRTYRAILDLLLKHEYKIDWAIREKPLYHYQYIHPRYDPHTMNEIWEEWGNKQNDAIGAFLFKLGNLEKKGLKIIRNDDDLRIIQKLVTYLQSIEYWHDPDNGMWEEKEEVHASSVGACVAGLKAIRFLVQVPNLLIENGEKTLKEILPRESETKETDLALLSLIYPYNIATEEQRSLILKNVEENLVREKGVIRYIGDQYYNKGLGEAEWTMGFPWLAIIYKQLNRPDKYAHYMRKTLEAFNDNGELPELYYSCSDIHNQNSPLGWSQALFLVMCNI